MAGTGVASSLMEMLASNPYFSAGAGLFGVGATPEMIANDANDAFSTYLPLPVSELTLYSPAAVGRQLFRLAADQARRRLVVSIELPSRDPSYAWLLFWMSKRVTKTQHLSLETSWKRTEDGKVDAAFHFMPSVGNHFFGYKGAWIKAERTRERLGGSQSGGGGLWEAVTLTMLGRDKELLFSLLREAKQTALEAQEGHTLIYTTSGPQWHQSGPPRRRRPFDSVLLPGNLANELLADVKDFLRASQWYADRGIPYRRGYLLHGPPGCGKSSFIQALAGELEYHICLLRLSEVALTDDHLQRLLTDAPERTIILLEDIDAAFTAVPPAGSTDSNAPALMRNRPYAYNTLTFSGLLNALDGVAAAEGRIVFMTTNHVEHLDPALIRPGRVDRLMHIGMATRGMVRLLFTRFFPDVAAVEVERALPGPPDAVTTLSMAHVQGVLLQHKNDADNALITLRGELERIESLKSDL